MVRLPVLVATSLLILDLVPCAEAQEMRVYTTVRNLAAKSPDDPAERAPVIARSLTLFHAGKIYDYVDSAREVTIYEPAHHRFTLLNEKRGTITSVDQDEVRQYLSLVEQEGFKRLEESSEQSNRAQLRSLAWLKFQLKPDVSVSFDETKNSLKMTENDFQYSVDGQAAPAREIVQAYLRFADSAAELNSVLHPQAPLPKPRLRLNEELRQRELLPVVVALQANLERPVHLQARHEWTWKFQSTDRQLISGWESQLNDATRRRIKFRQYQQETLTADVARR